MTKEAYSREKHPPRDVLIEFGYITPDQLNTALAYQKEHRDLRVGQALQELGYVNERQVLEALGPAPPA